MSIRWPIPEEQRKRLRGLWEAGRDVEDAIETTGIAEENRDFARSLWIDFDIFARIAAEEEAAEAIRKRERRFYRVSVMWGRGPKSTRPASWSHFGWVRRDGAVYSIDEIHAHWRGRRWEPEFFMTLREAIRLIGPVAWNGDHFEEIEGMQDFTREGFFARRELCGPDITEPSRERLRRLLDVWLGA